MELQYRVLGKVNNAFILRGLHFASERPIDFCVKESELGFVKQRCDIAELKVLNNLVSGYFDFAEIQAIRHNPMHMEDYIKQLDLILSSTGEKLLIGAGTVSHNKAIEKAKDEYKKYQVKTISPVEKEYNGQNQTISGGNFSVSYEVDGLKVSVVW